MNPSRPLPEYFETYLALLAPEVFLINICKGIYINYFLIVRGRYQYNNYANDKLIGQIIFVFSYKR